MSNEPMAQFKQLDPRIQNVIMLAEAQSDRGCLMSIVVYVGSIKREKQQAAWCSFEAKASRTIRDFVPLLHTAFDAVAAELEMSPAKRALANIKKKLAGIPANALENL